MNILKENHEDKKLEKKKSLIELNRFMRNQRSNKTERTFGD